MPNEQAIYELLVGQKIFSGGGWHVFDENGNELTDSGGVLWRGAPGALLMWPHETPKQRAIASGGGAAAGVASYKLPAAKVIDDDDDLRAAIIREDEEILAVIISAVTSGALRWVH